MVKKILLVDDDRLVLGSVAAALETAGYRVWATDSTEEALRLAREVEPDAVVTDFQMPGMDGISLLERVSEHAGAAKMVVYSARPRPQDLSAERVPRVSWVSKSAEHAALLKTLRGLLEGEDAAG